MQWHPRSQEDIIATTSFICYPSPSKSTLDETSTSPSIHRKARGQPTTFALINSQHSLAKNLYSFEMLSPRNILAKSSSFVKTKTDTVKFPAFTSRFLSSDTPGVPKRQRRQRPIFVAATKQHVGKTSTSLALLSGLQKRFDKVGFIKPVGQQHIPVHSTALGKEIRVDKDVSLMRETFNLDHIDYGDMSPVIIPRGYTKDYIEGKITHQGQLDKIVESFENVDAASDIVLFEGTGHCAVGSVVGVNNAQVAQMLGADVVLVANGGLGSAFDELELNRMICQHYGVRIAGVVINKVLPDKYEQTKHYMSKVLKQTWGVPLLGCIPDRPFLGCPALMDLETIFKTKLINGEKHRLRHYNVSDINLVTTSLTGFLENLRNKASRTMYVCHVTRDDLILGFMAEYQRRHAQEPGSFEAALVICGRSGKYQMCKEVKDMILGLGCAPVMLVEYSTHQAMQMIHDYTPKFNVSDNHRVATAVDHYEPYIDFDELLRRTRSSDSSFNEPGTPSLDEVRRL